MKVLYLTHRVPYAPNRGDRIRAYHILRYLKARGVSVCLVRSPTTTRRWRRRRAARSRGCTAHRPGDTRAQPVEGRVGNRDDQPLTHVLLDSPEMRPLLETIRREWQPDVVLAFCSGMARFALEPPLDTLHSCTIWWTWTRSSGGRSPAGPGVRSVGCTGVRPTYCVIRITSDAGSASDARGERPGNARALRTLDSAFTPIVLPNGVDIDTFRNQGAPAALPEVVFTGVFGYRPNEDGARWSIDHVWPRVRRSQPHAHLMLVGRGPSGALRKRARRAGVEVTGTVPDVRPYLWRAAIAVAPLETAHGVQNKVLEAVAAGLPVVVTSAVYEGLPRRCGRPAAWRPRRPVCRGDRGPFDGVRRDATGAGVAGRTRRGSHGRSV